MCIFVRQNPKCHEFEWLINWMYFMFCEMDMDTTTFTTMIAIIVGIVLLIILSLVIISFVRMAPCFLATAHLLRFDEHSAGSVYLVLLTYGGDVIENAHIFNVDTSTAFNETLGSAIFTLAVFGGALAVVNQFALTPAYFVRDTVFALFGLIFTTVVYVHEEIDLHYALIFMGIYFLYLVYVVVEFLIHQALYKVESKHSQERGLDFSIDDMAPAHQPIQLKFEVNDSLQYGELEGPNTFLFKQFFTSLNPIRLDVMKEMNTFFKCCFLVGMPLHVIYILCIPCFDYKLPNHGWSKLTICVNLVVAGPILVSLFTFSGTPYIFAWIPGTLLAVAVFFTSRTDRPPKYHIAFAFLGVIMCMAFHFVLEHELMNLFHNLGLFMGIRRQTIGLSFLAWADNITLAVWISRLADWGYSRTSFAAVYMGVLLGKPHKVLANSFFETQTQIQFS
ncbi:unnamed protein product [Hermetia illucens]|uniref:Uncharacterized protein n=1 Tax=Hermetia illucens TaxID=343691 RepID=A0A7R8UMN8_HERIL|nr:unnamed protein product [Hermetia illucens]